MLVEWLFLLPLLECGVVHCQCGWCADLDTAAVQSRTELVRARAEPDLEHLNQLLEEACLYRASVLPSSINFFSVLYWNATFPTSVIKMCSCMFSQGHGGNGIQDSREFIYFFPGIFFLKNKVLNRRKDEERLISWNILSSASLSQLCSEDGYTVRYKASPQKNVSRRYRWL